MNLVGLSAATSVFGWQTATRSLKQWPRHVSLSVLPGAGISNTMSRRARAPGPEPTGEEC
jgi:hypothetical protein